MFPKLLGAVVLALVLAAVQFVVFDPSGPLNPVNAEPNPQDNASADALS